MSQGHSKWKLIGPWNMTDRSAKFHKKLFSSFWVLLLTDKQTNRHWCKHNLVVVIEWWHFPSLPSSFRPLSPALPSQTSDVNKTKFLRPRQRPIFWSQTGLIVRLMVSDHITGNYHRNWPLSDIHLSYTDSADLTTAYCTCLHDNDVVLPPFVWE